MSQNYQQLNQFAQLPILGDTATKVNLNTLSVQIDPNSTNTLLPGDAVYLTQTAGTTILVDKCSATVAPFGYILYNQRFNQFIAGDAVEIGTAGQIMFLLAGGTISRGNNVEYDPSASLTTGPQVLASGGVNPISGLALDNATVGNLLRVLVLGVSYPVTATISGGFINNTPIGQSTAAAGSFTTLTASTSLSVTGNATATTVYDAIVALTPGATVSLNPTLAGLFTLAPTASCTINAASVPSKHQRIVIVITPTSTSSMVITFGSNFVSQGTLTTTTTSPFCLSFDGNGTNFIESSQRTTD
jgi:hypothetical protein